MPLLPSRTLEMPMNLEGSSSCLGTRADALGDSPRLFECLPRTSLESEGSRRKNCRSLQSLVRGKNSGLGPRGVSSLPLDTELSNCSTYPDFSRPRDDETTYQGGASSRRHSSMKSERVRVRVRPRPRPRPGAMALEGPEVDENEGMLGEEEEEKRRKEAGESGPSGRCDSRTGLGLGLGFAVAVAVGVGVGVGLNGKNGKNSKVVDHPSPPLPLSGATIEKEADYVVDPVRGNGYCKGQFLGKGGFARVYLMTDVSNGNRYACKIIPKNRMQKIHMQKIAREIMIHRELNHVNVVQMHHYFEDNANVYMLLEACPRKSLMHVLKYRGKVTEPEARYYMRQMVTGVAYIHSQRVVHRDLKPGNMFLSDRMIVKIGDFGLATRPDGQRRRVTICGTPNYIAPEVLYKQAYSYEADVWALGCILYALLVGRPPFDTATLKETYARICNNQYRPPDDTMATRNGQDLIKCLLQPNPQLRPTLEKVKEHVYLTEEYVPASLPHSCCYRQPNSLVLDPTGGSSLATSSASSASSVSAPASASASAIAPASASVSASSNSSSTAGASVPSHTPQQIVPGGNLVPLRRQDYRRLSSLQQQQRTTMAMAMAMAMTTASTAATTNTATTTATTTTTWSCDRARKTHGKKPKVSKWLARKLPKLPKFRERLSSVLCPDRKKPGLPASPSIEMHRALESCVYQMEGRATQNPPTAGNVAPLFVTKWIDYSNKYGLSFQLSDKSVGVLFNDNTKMSYAHDRRRVEYMTTEDEVTRFHREKDVPAALQTKLDLLRHFTQYMDNFLTEGGETRECQKRHGRKGSKNGGCVPRMRRWLRTDKAIVMELTVPLLQVNFFVDHTKMVVSQEWPGRDYLVTYIDTGRHAFSYWLDDLRAFGCTPDLYERLRYVSEITREFAELDESAYV